MTRHRPSRRLATARVWNLSVLWVHHREPERPEIVVVYVDAATGRVIPPAPGRRALPAARSR